MLPSDSTDRHDQKGTRRRGACQRRQWMLLAFGPLRQDSSLLRGKTHHQAAIALHHPLPPPAAATLDLQGSASAYVGVVIGHGLVVSSQPNKTLVQNCIRLEPGSFRTRLLDFLVQNLEPFTTPKRTTRFTGASFCRRPIVRVGSFIRWAPHRGVRA